MSRFRSGAVAAVAAALSLTVTAGVSACGGTTSHAAASPTRTPARAVSVVARDFDFTGIPNTVRTGASTWTLTNNGNQPHELGVIAIDAGHSLADVQRALSGSAPPSWAHQVGGIQPILPGKSQSASFDLKAGTYVVMCMVADPSSDKPHAMLGMLQEFHVA